MKRNIIMSKISIKLLVMIAVSFFFAVTASLVFARYVSYKFLIDKGKNLSIIEYNLFAIGIFAVGIGVFICCFLLFINKEIRYIKYIADRVKRIAGEDFGLTLEIRGSDELSELCTNINYMSKELKDKFEYERNLENTKTELITNVSHDLRTPLTAIIGYLDILRNKKFNNAEEEREYLNSTYNLSIKLKKLIDELFEYTKLSGEVNLDLIEADICAILNQIVGEYTPVFENKGLSVISHIPDNQLMVKIDVENIVRVFDNILNNAEKYSHESSDIIINVESTNGFVIISFSNEGENISQEKLNKMFERFYRVDTSRSSKIQGSGLGLSISQKIVDLHKGEIWAESKEEMITFKVKLKLIKN